MWQITCGACGASAPVDQWQTTASQRLAPDQYRCPLCQVRINKINAPAEVVYVAGHPLIIPGDVTLVVCHD